MKSNIIKIAFGVDILNGFAHPHGGLYVPGGEEVVAPATKIIHYICYLPDSLIFLAADSHPPNSKHFKVNGGKWPVHCVRDTWDALFHNDLLVPYYAVVFLKGTGIEEDGYDPWSGKTVFGETPLYYIEKLLPCWNRILENPEIQIFFFGIATNFCVMAGVLTACKLAAAFKNFRNFKIFLVTDACKAVENVSPPDLTGEEAIEKMKAAGAITVTTEEVINGRI